MPVNNQDYKDHIDELLAVLTEAYANGRDIDVAMCVTGLEANRQDNYRVREYAMKTLKIPAKTFDSALKRETLRGALGTDQVPQIASEYIQFIVDRLNITVEYNGLLHKKERPWVAAADADDGKGYIPPHMWDNYEFKTYIATKFHCPITFSDFCLEVRTFAVDHGLPWKASELNDASQMWYRKATQERVWRIAAEIDYTDDLDTRKRGQQALQRLAETCFDTTEVSSDFIVAVLNKFIHQVKCKIKGLDVADHLMAVLIGIQGNGKSTLIRQMLAPIKELWVASDFKQITDERNTMLWKNYAIFLDEMGWASKSDIDTVKNVITAEHLTRRIMQTTDFNTVRQCATFIGASNMIGLSDLIKDTSGTRRFVTLHMIDQPDRAVVNAMDWLAVWQSVDETKADPMQPHRAALAEVQARDRTLTTVEDWLASLDGAMTGTLKTSYLYEIFREYEKTYAPDRRPTSMTAFGIEMKARAKQPGSRFEVEISTRTRQSTYQWRVPAK